MKWTINRHRALKLAAAGQDYPGSGSVRRALEAEGLLCWTGPPRIPGVVQEIDPADYPLWRITAKGRELLSEWDYERPQSPT